MILFVNRKRGAFLNLVRTSTYNWRREDHRELLRGMTMTVCDLAAITKPWNVEKRVCILGSLFNFSALLYIVNNVFCEPYKYSKFYLLGMLHSCEN